MRITGGFNQAIINQKPNTKKVNANNQEKFSINNEKIEIKNGNKNSTDIWVELANKYNIKNATFEELSNISKELYKAGEISLFEHGLMTLRDPSKSSLFKFTNNLTAADKNGRRDWIVEFQARMQRDQKTNNELGYKNNLKAFEILSRLAR